MKKIILTFAALLFLGSSFFAQSDSDIYKAKEWTWFGIDYTNCYFITPMDFPNVADLYEKIGAWNDLIIMERAKFIDKPLKGKKITYFVDMVKDLNDEIDVKSRLTEDDFMTTHMEVSMVEEMVANYEIPEELTGIGLVFIAESYSKPNVKGAYYVTFFDIATKRVLSTERILGKASGFGLRNYWAGSYYNVMKSVGKKY